jgi:hypothetical protein
MSFDFINPWMLAGLAGVSLPFIAHLLSRKKYDVVQWGAMQFLELGRNARRRVRLEELLLMLLRMGMIALIAIALSRPWMSGPVASGFSQKPACDVALIIDSSYSTDWRGKAKTPRQAEVGWAKDLVSDLTAGDTIGLLDARGHVTSPVPGLTRDRNLIRNALDELPQPSGTSRLNEAIIRGLQLVNTGSNVSRHVVVVTDAQARPWLDADEHFQLQLKELREQSTIPADVWVVSAQKQQAKPANDSIDGLQLSRELTVVDFPVRIRTRVRNTGGRATANRKVYLDIDGQRLADKTLSVRVEPDGQATVEFEHRFRTPGSHLISVYMDSDSLPGDDRAEAALSITDALPVLLVDGKPHADVTRAETFFATSALTAPGNPTPWVAARTIPWTGLTRDSIGDAQVIVLANVARLTDDQADALAEFVDGGGGLAVTVGDQTDTQFYNDRLFNRGRGLLPAWLGSLETAPDDEDAPPVLIQSESLQLPWISRFQTGGDDGFLDARYSNWYRVELNPELPPEPEPEVELDKDAVVAEEPVRERAPATAAARFTIGDAFIVSRQFGRGRVALLTSTLDADWTTLPAKPDYVAFLHELIFQLASGRIARNVDVGTPLLFPVTQGDPVENWVCINPDDEEMSVQPAGDELRPMIRVDDTWLPGVYRLRKGDLRPEFFVVDFDRSESDLTPLTDERWAELTEEDRLRRIETPAELFEALKSDTARVELWHLLLLVFLIILVGEVYLTRRLVQGGHHFVDDEEAAEPK